MVKSDDPISNTFFASVEKAIAFCSVRRERGAFDKVAHHAVGLLEDAMTMYRAGSYGTAVFLAITSMEEVAKAEVTIFRRARSAASEPHRKDPLFSHKTKHIISVRPTTFMGKLQEILGSEACSRLQSEAQAGEFLSLREAALYADIRNGITETPQLVVSHERATELMLLALEVADDVLVGFSGHSFVLGERIGPWFDELTQQATVIRRNF